MNSSEDEYDSEGSTGYEIQYQPPDDLLSRCVIHLDVDYFYCQCEEIANPTLACRPVAIGQKHIIVTSNYIARSMGVKKLQSKSEALSVCPSLLIIDGSDLERYRDASSFIYATFRKIVKSLHRDNKAKRGGMDEYFADITCAVESQMIQFGGCSSMTCEHQTAEVWIYGEDAKSSTVKIVEDQTGVTSISTLKKCSYCENWGSKDQRAMCLQKLHIAINMAKIIQDEIKKTTRFSSTVGISVSPMLAKIASGLRKPFSCNVLYPWRSHTIIETMPLQRVPEVGSRTLNALKPLLEKFHVGKRPEFWMCRDLLDIPQHAIQSCLKLNQNTEFCNLLINRCRGIDTEIIRDDEGALSKTLSVENSFRRGTVTSIEKVIENVDSLIPRILRLLEKRTIISHLPNDSFPRVIRLTARILPLRNISKQMKFDGKSLLQMTEKEDQVAMLRKDVVSLLSALQDLQTGLDVTRLNLAMTSFADIDRTIHHQSTSRKKESISVYFQPESDLLCCDKVESNIEPSPKPVKIHNIETKMYG
jgi:Nucleotidyltransferase/DNA polymerase involved in DNA repair